MELEKLNIDTQKDQIIARLILQKFLLYVEYTERWLDGFASKKECQHVIKYAIESDKEAFKEIYTEVVDTEKVLIDESI